MVKKTEWIFTSKKEMESSLIQELKELDWLIFEDEEEGIYITYLDDMVDFIVPKGKPFKVVSLKHIPEKDDDKDDLFIYENEDDEDYYELEYGDEIMFCKEIIED